MTIAVTDRPRIDAALRAIERDHDMTIIGEVPSDTIGHVEAEHYVALLAEAGPSASYWTVINAEIALSALFGIPVGLRMTSEVKDPQRLATLRAEARPV